MMKKSGRILILAFVLCFTISMRTTASPAGAGPQGKAAASGQESFDTSVIGGADFSEEGEFPSSEGSDGEQDPDPSEGNTEDPGPSEGGDDQDPSEGDTGDQDPGASEEGPTDDRSGSGDGDTSEEAVTPEDPADDPGHSGEGGTESGAEGSGEGDDSDGDYSGDDDEDDDEDYDDDSDGGSAGQNAGTAVQRGIARVSVVDAVSASRLDGASMSVVDPEGTVVLTWESGGEVEIIRDLAFGKEYTIKQDRPPKGYRRAADLKFTIDENNKVTLIEEIPASEGATSGEAATASGAATAVSATTTDEAGNTVILVRNEMNVVRVLTVDASDRKAVEGAKLRVFTNDGTTVDEWVSGAEAHAVERIEAGTTSLALPGTELTGYSENHKGLFGIKAEWKLGDWWLTTIASQDGGSQEKYTINASSSTTEFQILDKQFIAYRYYFLNHTVRSNYISAFLAGGSTSSYTATGLKLYKRAPSNTTKDVVEKVTAVYTTMDGQTIEKVVDRLVPMDSSDYSYDKKTGIVKVLGASKNTLIAASWSDDGTGRVGSTVTHGSRVVLIQWDATLSELTDIDKLMLRNVYSIGISDESASSFVLRAKNKSGISGTYLKTLGLVDTTTNTILTGDATIFKKDASGSYTGEMWLPCRPLSWYSGANSSARAHENCLEPFRNVDSSAAMAKLYTLPVSNLGSKYTSRFYFESVGKRKNSVISVRDPSSSYSVNAGSCMDISEGSEKLKAGSTVLTRGVDYDVNYELGQIELLSETALDPNKEITVEFECEPLFEIDNKVLLGARAELPLTRYGFGEGSLFGITALYKSQSTTASTPTLGSEPYSSFLWGMNLRLQDTTQWMTDLVNMIPGIDTKATSNWRFETEFASSYHNANTSSGQSALLEDFESSESGEVVSLS